jgi:hypothetical protein
VRTKGLDTVPAHKSRTLDAPPFMRGREAMLLAEARNGRGVANLWDYRREYRNALHFARIHNSENLVQGRGGGANPSAFRSGPDGLAEFARGHFRGKNVRRDSLQSDALKPKG